MPGPFFSTVVLGGMAILEMGNEALKQKLLPQIAEGNLIVTLALVEPGSEYGAEEVATKAVPDGNNYAISGTKLFVPDAHIADYIICVAKAMNSSELFLIDSKSPGIKCTLLKTIAGDKQCEVVFNKVKVPKENVLDGARKG